MPRIRTVKPEFWSSPDMKGCPPWGRLLYIAMWQWADDTGIGTANWREIHAFMCPFDDDPEAPAVTELPSLAAEVLGRFGVILYEVRGRRYYYVPTFDGHQRTERRAKSRYPQPDEGTIVDPIPPEQPKRSERRKSSEAPTSSDGISFGAEGNSVTGTGEQGNRGTGEKDLAIAKRFDEFWAAYPRKDGKAAAKKAWPKACKVLDPERLVKAAVWWAGKWADAEVKTQFIPHASTWLNGQRWDDEPPAPRLRAVSGGHQPYQNPTDISAYYEEL